MTLRPRYRAKKVHDCVGEDKAWKAFAFVPMTLLNTSKGGVQFVGTSGQLFERRVVDTSGGRTMHHAKVATHEATVSKPLHLPRSSFEAPLQLLVALR